MTMLPAVDKVAWMLRNRVQVARVLRSNISRTLLRTPYMMQT